MLTIRTLLSDALMTMKSCTGNVEQNMICNLVLSACGWWRHLWSEAASKHPPVSVAISCSSGCPHANRSIPVMPISYATSCLCSVRVSEYRLLFHFTVLVIASRSCVHPNGWFCLKALLVARRKTFCRTRRSLSCMREHVITSHHHTLIQTDRYPRARLVFIFFC